MRIVSVVIVIWLIIGAIAAGQRHYYNGRIQHCSRFGTVTLNILAGPLNYVGVDPKVGCSVPQPSK